jgi:hypothetical protein
LLNSRDNQAQSGGNGRPAPRLRHSAGLAGLLAFLGYFGVWRGCELVALHFGLAWAVAAAVLGILGMLVVAVVGVAVIRAMRQMENIPPPDQEGDTARK